MMANSVDFKNDFCVLTDHYPFPWQQGLFRRFVSGEIPRTASLPTGLGKTSIVPIWLLAWLEQPDQLPRRLVYVVNRRTVVDQTTAEIMRLRENLPKLGRTDVPTLAISTLRGQFADNQEWSADPSRPAVICGTVDMIGSRLLFNGYRIGFKSRPLHAGFLGQDALLVHDEAHLEPAFQSLIEKIEKEQREGERTGDLPWPKLRVMALSATVRKAGENEDTDTCFELTEDERVPPKTLPDPPTEAIHHVWRRQRAKKNLCLREVGDGKGIVAKEIARIAAGYEDANAAVLVFVRRLDDIGIIEKELAKTKHPVVLLTGTMRGKERDKLVDTDEFKRFLKGATPGATVYLVCTSAGEVGVDISADHMVCDLSTFESMAQRLGRVNRFGDGDSRVDVVYSMGFDTEDRLAVARANTLKLLQCLPLLPPFATEPDVPRHDASPKALGELRGRSDLPCSVEDAFSPTPTILDATDTLFDAWALTTIRGKMPGRPPIGSYLHGIAEWEPPRTHVAWRDEVEIVTGGFREFYRPVELLEDYPLKPHELLCDRSERVFDVLRALAATHANTPVWILDEQGNVTVSPLGEVADPSATQAAARKPLISRIENCTILLPPTIGGLSHGMLDSGSSQANDVADLPAPATERRVRIWSDDAGYEEKTSGMRLLRSIDLTSSDDDLDDAEPRTWDWYKSKPLQDTRSARSPVEWDVHIRDSRCQINQILAGLSLPAKMAEAVRLAVKLHDHGKRRLPFQLGLGNMAYPGVVLAKSGRNALRLPEVYRHEFGSMADAIEDADYQQLSPEMQNLVLHLIGAHHGRGRPHFEPDEVFDPAPGRTQSQVDDLAAQVPQRFARLQRKFGRWGLAYLESLVRAADWAASAEPSAYGARTKEGLK
jgi:CRISPR-associated endonuclease/helicase Cas3